MGYLFSQTFLWLLLALLLGLFLGWLLRGILCPCRDEKTTRVGADARDSTGYTAASSAVAASEPVISADDNVSDISSIIITDDMRPVGLAAPNGEADDLKRIKGVGPVIQDTLNELGIFHFQQIADFTANNVAWVDDYIAFPGRIDRENWISQAAVLVKGITTEFAERYDRGEVGEDNPNT